MHHAPIALYKSACHPVNFYLWRKLVVAPCQGLNENLLLRGLHLVWRPKKNNSPRSWKWRGSWVQPIAHLIQFRLLHLFNVDVEMDGWLSHRIGILACWKTGLTFGLDIWKAPVRSPWRPANHLVPSAHHRRYSALVQTCQSKQIEEQMLGLW